VIAARTSTPLAASPDPLKQATRDKDVLTVEINK
jgi:hypothetical protein